MNEAEARKIFTDSMYHAWEPGDKDALLDGEFTVEELEALVFLMRANPPTPHESDPPSPPPNYRDDGP